MDLPGFSVSMILRFGPRLGSLRSRSQVLEGTEGDDVFLSIGDHRTPVISPVSLPPSYMKGLFLFGLDLRNRVELNVTGDFFPEKSYSCSTDRGPGVETKIDSCTGLL